MDSVCPYCAVGSGELVYVKGEKVTQIEGDPERCTQHATCPVVVVRSGD